MRLENFTYEHSLKLRFLILDYLFITDDFETHYKIVQEFEDMMQISFVTLKDVCDYFKLLQNRKKYFSSLISNGYLYVQEKREEIHSLSGLIHKKQVMDLNYFIYVLHDYKNNILKWRNWEKFFPGLSEAITNVQLENEKSFISETEQFFLITKAIMGYPNSIDVISTLSFFEYCEYLLKDEKWLLLEQDYLITILSILKQNQDKSSEFFKQNQKIRKRIQKFAQKNRINVD